MSKLFRIRQIYNIRSVYATKMLYKTTLRACDYFAYICVINLCHYGKENILNR